MEITEEDVRSRNRASEVAKQDAALAANIALSIRHPWYRCQALSAAADAEPDLSRARELLSNAFIDAYRQEDINRIVTVASWPMRVCARRFFDAAISRLRDLLSLAEKEPHTLRRGDALLHIFFAVEDHPVLKRRVLPALVESLTAGRGWRIEKLMAATALTVKDDYPEYIPQLVAAHRENKQKRKLLEKLGIRPVP